MLDLLNIELNRIIVFFYPHHMLSLDGMEAAVTMCALHEKESKFVRVKVIYSHWSALASLRK